MEKRFHCPHCDEKISKTLYNQYKQHYYTSSTNTWNRDDVPLCTIKSRDTSTSDVQDFDFSDADNVYRPGADDLEIGTQYGGFGSSDSEGMNTHDEIEPDDEEESFDLENEEVTEIWFEEENDTLETTPPVLESRTSRIVRLYVLFLFMWQTLFKISDSGMSVLFFLATFLSLLFLAVNNRDIQNFITMLPRSSFAAKKLLGLLKVTFSKYVSCPKCHILYSVDSCKIRMPDRSVTCRFCSHVTFPHHPHRNQRSPCNTLLMKTIRTSSGTTSLYLRQSFCYYSIISSIRNLLLRPGFFTKTEQWRDREYKSGTLSDIYDGNVWKEFLCPFGIPFLSVPYNFALILNIDWFQPFKHSTYSVGAMCMAIANLPRTERYMSDNVILVGIIPGPKEPKGTINTYLQPLINDLNELWTGVTMQTVSGMQIFVRAALLCTACDIPATRKFSGFVFIVLVLDA